MTFSFRDCFISGSEFVFIKEKTAQIIESVKYFKDTMSKTESAI